jgi:hypothetical protein
MTKHDTPAAALAAADDRRREGLARFFGIKPEPEPPQATDDVGTGWGAGASGGNPPDAGSLDERVDRWLKDYSRRNRSR